MVEAGAEPGEQRIHLDQLRQQRIVHHVGCTAGHQLLDDPAVPGQLVPRRRNPGSARERGQGRRCGVAAAEDRPAPVRPPHVCRADLATRTRSVVSHQDARLGVNKLQGGVGVELRRRLHPGRVAPGTYDAVVDLSAFYAVVSGINFTLLGLWWVAVRERAEIGVDTPFGRRMAYLVSLQFVIPGTVSLLSQVAPNVPEVWRTSFALAGVAGAAGSVMLAKAIRGLPRQSLVANLIAFGAVPLYAVAAVIAVTPPLSGALSSLQVEAILLCVLVFLGVQAAWVVAMAPKATAE